MPLIKNQIQKYQVNSGQIPLNGLIKILIFININFGFSLRLEEICNGPQSKKIVIAPIDGSKDSLRSLNYLNLYFGKDPDLKAILLYILPALPPLLVEECKKDPAAARQLKKLSKRTT
jgi:hypothetical protein